MIDNNSLNSNNGGYSNPNHHVSSSRFYTDMGEQQEQFDSINKQRCSNASAAEAPHHLRSLITKDLKLPEHISLIKVPQANKNIVGHSRATSSIQFAPKNSNTAIIQEEKPSQQHLQNNNQMILEETSCEKENHYQKDFANLPHSQLPHHNNGNTQTNQQVLLPLPPHKGMEEKRTMGRSLSINNRQSIAVENITHITNNNTSITSKQQPHQEYLKEIITHLKATEEQTCTQGGYVGTMQNEINERMRSILLDWLVDVHYKFKLRTETLFMAVNLTDRFLERVQIGSSKLQLLGITSLFIAAKYEEVYDVPHILDLVYVCDNAYSKQELLDMEGHILQSINFQILSVSSSRFLEFFVLYENQFEEKNLFLAKYLLEIALLEYKLLKMNPSVLASSVLYLVNKIRKRPVAWRKELQDITGYEEQDIRPTAKQICHIVQTIETRKYLTSLKKKYSSSQFMEVSKIKIEQRSDQSRKSTETNFNNVQTHNSNNSSEYNSKDKLCEQAPLNTQVHQYTRNNTLITETNKDVAEIAAAANYVQEVHKEIKEQKFQESNEQQEEQLILENNQDTSSERQDYVSITVPIQSACCLVQRRIVQLAERPNNLICALLANRLYPSNDENNNNQSPLNININTSIIIEQIHNKINNISIQQLNQLPISQLKVIAEAILNPESLDDLNCFTSQFTDVLIESIVKEQITLSQQQQQQQQKYPLQMQGGSNGASL